MKDTKKYYDYIDKLINDTPDFMMINDDESYVLLDRLVVDLSENAMPWLFKVYLDNNYNILERFCLVDWEYSISQSSDNIFDWHSSEGTRI